MSGTACDLIYQHIYNRGTRNERFVPVVINERDAQLIPIPIQGATFYCLGSPDGYDRLYGRLTGQVRVEKPPLGKRRALPKREVKTDPSMYLTGPINIELWDQARWSATFFMWADDRPPVIGLAFQDESVARQIFEDWRRRYGDDDDDDDEYKELRVAIIEGDVE